MRLHHDSCQIEYLLELGEERIICDLFSKEKTRDNNCGSDGMDSKKSCNKVAPGPYVLGQPCRIKEKLKSFAPSMDIFSKFWLL
jgi:hypothetical protein